jgi:histone demethylase JARID1
MPAKGKCVSDSHSLPFFLSLSLSLFAGTKMHRTASYSGDPDVHQQQHHHNRSSSTQRPHSLISCGHGYPVDGGDFEFVSPPEAPIFHPTEAEFAEGPLEYVAKIRPVAEAYGICKIVPPPSFKPTFAVDRQEFTFTPRVQRLNELEALTRIKLNFLEQVIKFWDLQGAHLKIPYVDKRPIDLHLLHKTVQEEGGFESCTRDKKWSRVAVRLGYNTSRQNKGPVASLLRQHYERILFPYDVFLSGATIVPIEAKIVGNNSKSQEEEDRDTVDQDKCSREEASPSKETVPRRMTRRSGSYRPSSTVMTSQTAVKSKELRKLEVHGAGPKMPGVVIPSPSCISSSLSKGQSLSSSKKDNEEDDDGRSRTSSSKTEVTDT